jgi:hypothetical protein
MWYNAQDNPHHKGLSGPNINSAKVKKQRLKERTAPPVPLNSLRLSGWQFAYCHGLNASSDSFPLHATLIYKLAGSDCFQDMVLRYLLFAMGHSLRHSPMDAVLSAVIHSLFIHSAHTH